MKKRILAIVSATAIVAMLFGATPQAAKASSGDIYYDYYVSASGNDVGAPNDSCAAPYSTDLQDALDDYESGDTIYLCAGTYGGPFYAENGDVTIVGAGAKKSIINGSNYGDPAISVGYWDGDFYTDDLTIDSLTITAGWSNDAWDWDGYGGGVYANDFTCRNSVLSNNYADRNGGGVFATGNVESTKCTYFKNGAEGRGGAIDVAYNITDTSSVYSGNYAWDDGGGVNIEARADDSEDSSFTKSTFINNNAGQLNESGWFQNGGAIHVNDSQDEDLFIYASKFTNNQADDQGGAIYTSDWVQVHNSQFTNNTAAYGGAIYTEYQVYLNRNTFKANRATNGWGGAFYSENYAEVTSNTFLKNFALLGDGHNSNGGYADCMDIYGANTRTVYTTQYLNGGGC